MMTCGSLFAKKTPNYSKQSRRPYQSRCCQASVRATARPPLGRTPTPETMDGPPSAEAEEEEKEAHPASPRAEVEERGSHPAPRPAVVEQAAHRAPPRAEVEKKGGHLAPPRAEVEGQGAHLAPPQRRAPGAAAPDYGLCADKFSVDFHHSGFFCGTGINRSYLEGEVDWFDECSTDNWSQNAVGPDDAVLCGNPLPDIISPISPIKVVKSRKGRDGNSDDASDSDLCDSDYDLKDSETEGDDSDFDKAVDSDVSDNLIGKKVDDEQWSDEVDEDTELEVPANEDEFKIDFKTKSFNPDTDMANPIFKLSMVFSSMSEVRRAITEHSIKERVQIRKRRNNAKRLEASCEKDCTWKLNVSKDNRTGKFLVKEFIGEHTCERVWNVKQMSYTYLAKRFVEEFRDNENISLKSFGNIVQKEVNMLPSRFKLAKAKYKALLQIHGDEKKQFNSLYDYGEELRRLETILISVPLMCHFNSACV